MDHQMTFYDAEPSDSTYKEPKITQDWAMPPSISDSSFDQMSKLRIPTPILRNKMISSLKSMQMYSDTEINRVQKLIDENTLTSTLTGYGPTFCTDEASAYHKLKVWLLDLTIQLENINTNELVLLMEFDDWLDPNLMYLDTKQDFLFMHRRRVEGCKRAVLQLLKQMFGLLPVRVYIRSEIRLPENFHEIRGSGGDSLSHHSRLTFLNVVNTNIGGPSMIQLLDHKHEEHQWRSLIAQIEARYCDEVLWQDNRLWMSPNMKQYDSNLLRDDISTEQPNGVRMQDNSGEDDSGELKTQSPGNIASPRVTSTKAVHDQDHGIKGVPCVQTLPLAGAERSETPINNSVPNELESTESEKRSIDHPTWQHMNSEGTLIDLIQMQASQVSEASSDAEIVVHAEDETPNIYTEDVDGFEFISHRPAML